MKKIDKKFVFSLLFNIIETLLIFLVGKLLSLPISNILIVMLAFMITRGFVGSPLHYKTWYRCLVFSVVIMLSLFLILKLSLTLSVLFAIYAAFIMTGKSNIQDMYLWKSPNESKYKDIEEYIKYHFMDSALLDFEDNLKRRDDILFLIYKYRFREKLTFAEISEKLNNMENPRIVESLDQIALAIRIACKI